MIRDGEHLLMYVLATATSSYLIFLWFLCELIGFLTSKDEGTKAEKSYH